MSKQPSLYHRLKLGLSTAAAVIIGAPVKLPPNVVAGAKCVVVLIGLLDALEADAPAPDRAVEGEANE